MTRTTPELSPSLQTHLLSKLPHHINGRAFGPDGFNVHQTRLHDGSLVESDFEPPRALRTRGRNLITRPPRPRIQKGAYYEIKGE
ncbi:hypothetical protein AVEN_150709-1 [Araneus ventricosus]|uniref:Uncharacterized protein n=1 Tax=Araneus ventricosus TaxID=182803 RepID=A0A4Y2EGY4_ARAVE|nr:hypothetical protein AVEN_150709-1 [Araneus ventricosus]